jgi:hypothetical protein
MLVQQTARFLHQRKQSSILLKLEISKAFDSISWSFLLEVMQHMGFGQIWRVIISELFSSASTRVLMNAIPGGCIAHRSGLRQGDPLSPMLFILAMDVMGFLITKAESGGLLQPFSSRTLQHRVSFYADDVVLFLHPVADDIAIIMDILELFGEALGLRNNVQKSSAYPIQCDDNERSLMQQLLPCQMADFLCKYLGLPMSLKKLTKDQIQPYIDKIADQLPGWKADLLTKPGRRILVQFVLTSMLIYLAMAVDLPAWAHKAIDKLRRGFFWRGRKEAKGGHCHVAWSKVCRPMELGGLGISSLKESGWALRMRWLWLHKTESSRPWSALPIKIPEKVQAFFAAAMQVEIGDGSTTCSGKIDGYMDSELWMLHQDWLLLYLRKRLASVLFLKPSLKIGGSLTSMEPLRWGSLRST